MPSSSRETGSQVNSVVSPFMKDILGNAKWLFNSGAAWTPNQTSKVTPFSTQTRQALTGMNRQATGAAPLFQQNLKNVWKTINDGGLNDLQDQQVGRLQGIAGGNGLNDMQQQAANQYAGVMGGNGLNDIQQSGSDMLQKIAAGGDMQNNPYLEDVIKRSSGDIANSDNLMASLGGRYGSGSHQGVLEKDIGDMSSNLRFNDYSNQQARRDAAIRDYFGTGTTGYGQKNQATGNFADLGTAGFGQKADAIGSLYNAGTQQRSNKLAGTGQLADAFSAEMDPYKVMGQVGSTLEGKNQQQIGDATRIFNENKASLTDPLNWLSALASGYTQQNQTQNTNTNPLLNMFGGAIKGYDTFGGPKGGIFGGLTGLFA